MKRASCRDIANRVIRALVAAVVCLIASSPASAAAPAKLTISFPRPGEVITGTTLWTNFDGMNNGVPQGADHIDFQIDDNPVEHVPGVVSQYYQFSNRVHQFFNVPPGPHVLNAWLVDANQVTISERVSVPFTMAADGWVRISANPRVVTPGQSSTITWTSQNVSGCQAMLQSPPDDSSPWLGSRPASGSEVVKPHVSLMYGLQCTDAAGRLVGASARVNVTRGAQRTLVILTNLQDQALAPPFSDRAAMAQEIFNGPFNAYYREASYGKMWFEGTVVGPYTVPFEGCEWDSSFLFDAAVRAADPDVYFPDYQHVIVVHPLNTKPSTVGCWDSTAMGPGPLNNAAHFPVPRPLADGPSDATLMTIRAWDVGTMNAHLIRLMGFNLGLLTPDRVDCGLFAAQPPGVFSMMQASSVCRQYQSGDPFDVMGSGSGHFNAAYKDRLTWFDAGNIRAIDTPEDAGTYLLAPIEQSTAALQVLKIRRADGRWYYLEYRQSAGQGALMHLSTEPLMDVMETSRLMDLSGQGSFILPIGRTYADASGPTITSEAMVGGSLKVRIGWTSPTSAPVPTPASPTLTITSPRPNQSIAGSVVQVSYSKSGDLAAAGVDHVHFQLDGQPEVHDLNFDGVYQFTNVAAGAHVLTGYLATAQHTAVSGTAVTVRFSTTSPAPAPTPVPAPTLTFTAAPASVPAGQTAELAWSSTNAASCTASGGWTGVKSPAGRLTIRPAQTASYALTCRSSGLTTLSTGQTVTVTVTPRPAPVVNHVPLVAAGPDQTLAPSQTRVQLSGTASDDGLPTLPGKLTLTWARASGPGPVSFDDPHAAKTTATVTVPGVYSIMLTAFDGQYQRTDYLYLRFPAPPLPPRNMPPVIQLSPTALVSAERLPARGGITAVVTDDGLPTPPGKTTATWSKASGPGTVTFDDASATATTTTFSAAGSYVLRLSVTDGQYPRVAYLHVTVRLDPAAPPQ